MGRAGWHRVLIALCTCGASAALGACIPGPLTFAGNDGGLSPDGTSSDSATDDSGLGALDAPADADTGTSSSSSGSSSGSSGGDTGTVSDSAMGNDACTTGCGPPGCDCIDPVPGGWTLVAFDATSRTSCPSGYGSPADVIVDPSNLGPSTCGCTCDVTTTPDCYTGQVTIGYGTGVCNMTAGPYDVNGGGCVAVSIPFAASNHSMAPLAPTGGTCSPNVTDTPPSPGGGLGKQCSVSAALVNGGCSGSKVCAPPVTSLFDLCIAQSGQVPCPSGYPNAHVTGTGITSGGCSSCTCATPMTSCDSPTFSLFSDTECGSVLASLAADGNCHTVTTGGTAASYQYTATGSTTCVPPTQPTPTGNSSLSGLTTVCCP
jgi:hypothetical protein